MAHPSLPFSAMPVGATKVSQLKALLENRHTSQQSSAQNKTNAYLHILWRNHKHHIPLTSSLTSIYWLGWWLIRLLFVRWTLDINLLSLSANAKLQLAPDC